MASPTEVGWGDRGTSEGSGFSALLMSDTGGLAWSLGRLEKIKKHSPSFSSCGFQSVDRETAISFDFYNPFIVEKLRQTNFPRESNHGSLF